MADNQHGMYVANRNVSVATSKGYKFEFKKGVPVYVPPIVRADMLQHGILPVDGDMPVYEESERPAVPVGEDREARIAKAIEALAYRNDANDFTAAGVPKETAMLRETGFEVPRREINAAFSKWRENNAPGR